jgi:hypothetical protein
MCQYDREKLYEEAWAEPMQHIAKRYGVSDVFLGRVCRKLKLPLPGRGYWARKTAGKPLPKRPPLPRIDDAIVRQREGKEGARCRTMMEPYEVAHRGLGKEQDSRD